VELTIFRTSRGQTHISTRRCTSLFSDLLKISMQIHPQIKHGWSIVFAAIASFRLISDAEGVTRGRYVGLHLTVTSDRGLGIIDSASCLLTLFLNLTRAFSPNSMVPL